MKFKYKIKIFEKKKNKKNKKIIFGDLIIDKNIFNIYVFNNNYIKKIFKNNFLIINYLGIKYFTLIKKITFTFFKNKIDYFIIEKIKNKFEIFYKNNNKKIYKKLLFINNNLFPRSINLNVIYKKKILKETDFFLYSFFNNKKKLFFS